MAALTASVTGLGRGTSLSLPDRLRKSIAQSAVPPLYRSMMTMEGDHGDHGDPGDPGAVAQRLLPAARLAVERAYAPYSRFRVGSAVLTGSGSVYSGCNVENRSYGLTICAERAAVFAAVAAEGPGTSIAALAVVCDPERPCSPCGACRQEIGRASCRERV